MYQQVLGRIGDNFGDMSLIDWLLSRHNSVFVMIRNVLAKFTLKLKSPDESVEVLS